MKPVSGVGYLFDPRADLDYLTGMIRKSRQSRTEADGQSSDGMRADLLRGLHEPNKQRYMRKPRARFTLRALLEFLAANAGPRRGNARRRSTTSVARNYDKPGKILPLIYRVCSARSDRLARPTTVLRAHSSGSLPRADGRNPQRLARKLTI